MFRQSQCRVSCKEGWPTGNADCSHGKQSQRCSFVVVAFAFVASEVAAFEVAGSGSRLEWGFAVVAWEEAVGEGSAGSCRSFVPAVSDKSGPLTVGCLAFGEGDAVGVGSVAVA